MKHFSILKYSLGMFWLLTTITACAQQNEIYNNQNTSTNSGTTTNADKTDVHNSKDVQHKAEEKAVKNRAKVGDSHDIVIPYAAPPTPTTASPVNHRIITGEADGLFFSIEVLEEVVTMPTTDEDGEAVMGLSLEDIQPASKEAEKARGREDELPPMRQVRVKLSIQNRQTQPVWYLLPAQGEVELQDDGRFEAAAPTTAFAGRQYLGCLNEDSSQVGRLVECHFRGSYQNGFKAFYLPPQSSITLRNYPIEVWGDLKEIELWGVKSLLVNGSKPLQEWLPFSPIADSGNLRITCPTEGICSCKELGDVSKICNENINFMEARDYKKYHLILP